ncbi:hypothetical protein DAPPUDRAFT_108309 [Daphnia pulex]|uniref:Uncharacterized protein n=1 Tax=Daphnia pulex TaxID=6669 RepID=E9GZS4_DAPPU|nr:hypothetical protein DAPPUDRAFT_108309 [Daphnia pulex]|eukprot:EFX75044.1 hypothetical protein DAPPUDRAFT_108309 [Daphnia pulex]
MYLVESGVLVGVKAGNKTLVEVEAREKTLVEVEAELGSLTEYVHFAIGLSCMGDFRGVTTLARRPSLVVQMSTFVSRGGGWNGGRDEGSGRSDGGGAGPHLICSTCNSSNPHGRIYFPGYRSLAEFRIDGDSVSEFEGESAASGADVVVAAVVVEELAIAMAIVVAVAEVAMVVVEMVIGDMSGSVNGISSEEQNASNARLNAPQAPPCPRHLGHGVGRMARSPSGKLAAPGIWRNSWWELGWATIQVVAGMEAEMEVLVGGKLGLLNIGFGEGWGGGGVDGGGGGGIGWAHLAFSESYRRRKRRERWKTALSTALVATLMAAVPSAAAVVPATAVPSAAVPAGAASSAMGRKLIQISTECSKLPVTLLETVCKGNGFYPVALVAQAAPLKTLLFSI